MKTSWKLDHPVFTHNDGHFECELYLRSLINSYGNPVSVFNSVNSLTICFTSSAHTFYVDRDGNLHEIISDKMYYY